VPHNTHGRDARATIKPTGGTPVSLSSPWGRRSCQVPANDGVGGRYLACCRGRRQATTLPSESEWARERVSDVWRSAGTTLITHGERATNSHRSIIIKRRIFTTKTPRHKDLTKVEPLDGDTVYSPRLCGLIFLRPCLGLIGHSWFFVRTLCFRAFVVKNRWNKFSGRQNIYHRGAETPRSNQRRQATTFGNGKRGGMKVCVPISITWAGRPCHDQAHGRDARATQYPWAERSCHSQAHGGDGRAKCLRIPWLVVGIWLAVAVVGKRRPYLRNGRGSACLALGIHTFNHTRPTRHRTFCVALAVPGQFPAFDSS
jgi:hypothetical protein